MDDPLLAQDPTKKYRGGNLMVRNTGSFAIIIISTLFLTHTQEQSVKSSADPRNSAFFHGFLVTFEISLNLLRSLSCNMGIMGGGISRSAQPTEWFIYQNLQNFTRKTLDLFSE